LISTTKELEFAAIEHGLIAPVDDDQANFLLLAKEWKYYRLRKEEKRKNTKAPSVLRAVSYY